jgi:hypothetical protein
MKAPDNYIKSAESLKPILFQRGKTQHSRIISIFHNDYEQKAI